MEVQELRKKAAHYHQLADEEPQDEMREMLRRVAETLEELVGIRAKNERR
jgi:hypothetical protein